MPTIRRDDGTIVNVTIDRGWVVATYETGEVELSFREELRAWDAIKQAAEDDDGSDALRDFRMDRRA